VLILDQNSAIIASKEYIGNNFQQLAHVTLSCEGSVEGWQDGFFLVSVEADYEPEMGDITV
jgi:hypothetical protein